jgi:hypothetical protein
MKIMYHRAAAPWGKNASHIFPNPVEYGIAGLPAAVVAIRASHARV